ncbi:hypothetical protein [Ponticaulis sp.]|uniref:hypothetical protein n=1 Tax=Ponticaulis sp. TaxID=2020902 RepID=UPI000C3B8C45|nr:hypothetical protein [Ponticaulis sp.]MBN04487.1 hypothetical protein [Ponticaulis sp.]|tara:strand:- start:166 stop:537 length:372 start_codon:yes stop_codon:yes gene_type:complete
MTKLSERIEACTGDTTELAAEMLTFVTGKDVFEAGGMLVQKPEQAKINIHANPLTDLNAIAALERGYLSGQYWPVYIETYRSGIAYISSIKLADGQPTFLKAPTEALARSAALVRALEVSRDV